MAWYAYCITEQQAFHGSSRTRKPLTIENLTGIRGKQVFSCACGDLAVVVSDFAEGEQIDQSAARDHARVISECFRAATVLPFRFGTVFATDQALRRAVRVNRRLFMEEVGRLRGKAEMHIKVTVKDGSLREAFTEVALPQSVGSEYLSCLRQNAVRYRERQTKARALSVQVNKMFSPLQEEVSCRKADDGAMQLDIAHLIEHKNLQKYQNKLQLAARQLKDCDVALSGPWPPYHFVGKLLTGKPRTTPSQD